MQQKELRQPPVKAGDVDGLGTIYSQWGGLICHPDERIMRVGTGWEMEAMSPWRRILPGIIFTGFGGETSSKLYLTTDRIVLVRQIDTWRELAGELTPLGLPKAAEKEARLRRLQASGARQYCEVVPRQLKVVKAKSFSRPKSSIDILCIGSDGKEYALTYWMPQGSDAETLDALRSQFPETSRPIGGRRLRRPR